MKIKELIITLSKEDILGFFQFQNKLQVTNVIINDALTITGTFRITSININFETVLQLKKIESNIISISIDSFKVLKVNIVNPLCKKALNYVINAFSDIYGVTFEDDTFKLNLVKIINKYYKSQNILDLNTAKINDLFINKNEIQVSLTNISININEYQLSKL